MNRYEREFTNYKNIVARAYEKYSVIGAATRNRAFDEVSDRELHLTDIGISEEVPLEWFGNPAVCPEPYFYDIGRNIAIGEENYLVQNIREKAETEPISISSTRPAEILRIASEFVHEGFIEPVLFIPAELSVPLYVEAQGIDFTDNGEFLRISPARRAQIFLTSKYVRLNDLLLVDKSFGEWVFEQGNYSKTLTIDMIPTESETVRTHVKTRVFYKVMTPDAARILRLVPEG